jgi:hypothetical protein
MNGSVAEFLRRKEKCGVHFVQQSRTKRTPQSPVFHLGRDALPRQNNIIETPMNVNLLKSFF